MLPGPGLEGTEVCDWLTSKGITCVLLKYRVPAFSKTAVFEGRFRRRGELSSGFRGGAVSGHMLEHTRRPFELNPYVPVTENTPPTFLLQAENDPVDDIENSLVYFAALKKAKVRVEMHIYAEGGHAFGLRRTALPTTAWPELVEKWLAQMGIGSERRP